MSRRTAVASQWLRTFAALRVAQRSCALRCLYNDVELGPLSKTRNRTYVLHIVHPSWFTYSPRRATTTTVLAFRHQDVSGSQVTGILPRGLLTLFGHVAGMSEQELYYQTYTMQSLHAI